MSIQNNTIRPTFSKSVMGYTPGEVDKYVDHVSERYASVCRENTELKRRVLSLTARLSEAEEKIAELEKIAVTQKILDKSALSKIFDSLNEEKRRYVCFIDSLMEKLNSITADLYDDTPDDSWQTILDGFLEEVPPLTEGPAEAENMPSVDLLTVIEPTEDISEDTEEITATVENSADAMPAPDAASGAESPESIIGSDTSPKMTSPETEKALPEENTESNTESSTSDADEVLEAPTAPPVKKTPAELAAELDFYSDDTYEDGQSFDPMTIAAEFTSKKSKPTFADLMRPMIDPDNQ